MSTQITITSKSPALTKEDLYNVGIKFPAKASTLSAIRDDITRNGGFVPENASNELLVIVGDIRANSRVAAKSMTQICLDLALIDQSQEYKVLTAPNGKEFKSTSELFRTMCPEYSESTVRNYLNVGRKVYLPAAQGSTDRAIRLLAMQEPGSAQAAVSVLEDENARKVLGEELSKAPVDKKGHIPAKSVKAAAKVAKEAMPGTEPAKSNGADKATDKKDAKAKEAEHLEALRVALLQAMSPDKSNGELIYTVGEDRKARYLNTLKEACKDGDAALLFVKALYEISK